MAFDRNSKADTEFLGFVDAKPLDVDRSQYVEDLVDNTTYLVGTSTRYGIGAPREIAVVANLDNTQTGIIIQYGATTGVAPVYKISISGGSIVFVQGGSTLASIALPGVTGTPTAYLVHWSTGAASGGSVLSEFALCRIPDDSWTIVSLSHSPPPAPAVGDQLNVSGYGAGLSLFSGGIANILSVRLSLRFHSTTEAREDWVTESSAPTVIGLQPAVELAPVSTDYYEADHDTDVGDALLDEQTFTGPAEWLAALHAGCSRTRLISPLLNIVMPSPPVLQDTYLPANWHIIEPDPPGPASFGELRYGLQYLWLRPLPQISGLKARVRVHVQTYVAGGAPMGTTPELQLRLLSSGKLWPNGPTIPSSQRTALATCTTNHTSTGLGEWVNLGSLTLQRFDGQTFLALGYSLGDAGATGLSYRRAKIKAIQAELYTEG